MNTYEQSLATVVLHGVQFCTIHPKHPLMPWLEIAQRWPSYSEKARATLRPSVVAAVVHLFEKFAKEYEPYSCWFDEDFYNGGFDALRRIVGGTWNPNANRPYLLVLAAVGLTDDEIADLLAPIHAQNLAAACGECETLSLDDLAGLGEP